MKIYVLYHITDYAHAIGFSYDKKIAQKELNKRQVNKDYEKAYEWWIEEEEISEKEFHEFI